MDSDCWIPILVRVDPFERAIRDLPLIEHGVVQGLSLFTIDSGLNSSNVLT